MKSTGERLRRAATGRTVAWLARRWRVCECREKCGWTRSHTVAGQSQTIILYFHIGRARLPLLPAGLALRVCPAKPQQ